jgi:hypothetical protein
MPTKGQPNSSPKIDRMVSSETFSRVRALHGEWIKLNGLLNGWRGDSHNRELITEIGLGLERVGIIFDGSKITTPSR